jgi:protein TonB
LKQSHRRDSGKPGHRAIHRKGEHAMAYADANTASRKLGTGAIVLLIEGGLGVALVTGLAATGTISPRTVLTTYQIPKELPPPAPPPPVDKQVKDNPSVVDRPDTIVKLPPSAGASFTEDLVKDSGAEGTSSVGEVAFPRDPDPVPSPEPLFKPKNAAPKGQWKQWVTTNDYPTNALRMEHEGTARYRLTVDSAGRASDCAITATSGFADLDKATCDTLKRRAKFEPATDQTGARTSGSYTGSVNWQIPKE